MSMNYNRPDMVRSPRRYVKSIKPLYDGGEKSCSIAILEDCEGEFFIGIRWNVSEKEWVDNRKVNGSMVCVGMPQSRGCSVWFVLPRTFCRFIPQVIGAEIHEWNNRNRVEITEDQIQNEVDRILNDDC